MYVPAFKFWLCKITRWLTVFAKTISPTKIVWNEAEQLHLKATLSGISFWMFQFLNDSGKSMIQWPILKYSLLFFFFLNHLIYKLFENWIMTLPAASKEGLIGVKVHRRTIVGHRRGSCVFCWQRRGTRHPRGCVCTYPAHLWTGEDWRAKCDHSWTQSWKMSSWESN